MRTRTASWQFYGISKAESKELLAQAREPKNAEILHLAAQEANEGLGELLFTSLSQGLSYDRLDKRVYIPAGKDDFYGYRRKTVFLFRLLLRYRAMHEAMAGQNGRNDRMRLNGKKLLEIMDSEGLTAEQVCSRTGLNIGSVRWILNGGFASEEAAERMAEAVGVKLGEVLLPDASSNVENCIEFIVNSDRATVTFSQGRFKGRIRRLAEERPEECEIVAENEDGSLCAHIPVTWVKINPTLELAEEERQRKAEIMRQNRSKS